jgi:hypothetical protein
MKRSIVEEYDLPTDQEYEDQARKDDNYLARIAARAGRPADARPVNKTYEQQTPLGTRQWVQGEIEAACNTLSDIFGDHTAEIRREERQHMQHMMCGYMQTFFARERQMWRQQMNAEISKMLGEALGHERSKWKRDIYDAVEWANKGEWASKGRSLKGEVVPMVWKQSDVA